MTLSPLMSRSAIAASDHTPPVAASQLRDCRRDAMAAGYHHECQQISSRCRSHARRRTLLRMIAGSPPQSGYGIRGLMSGCVAGRPGPLQFKKQQGGCHSVEGDAWTALVQRSAGASRSPGASRQGGACERRALPHCGKSCRPQQPPPRIDDSEHTAARSRKRAYGRTRCSSRCGRTARHVNA